MWRVYQYKRLLLVSLEVVVVCEGRTPHRILQAPEKDRKLMGYFIK